MTTANIASTPEAPLVNDRREIFGWMMYDWANSAFSTTVAGALLSPICIAVSVLLQVFLLPVLGAIADYSHLKKRLMALFCYIGAIATCLLFFVTGNLYLLGGLLFIVANLSFGASIVLYNAFLPDICTEDQSDKVSSRGFALGYMGGGLLLAMNFGLLLAGAKLGISPGLAVRLSLLSAGLWWGGFALITFARLKTRAPARSLPPDKAYYTIGFSELRGTFRELARLPHTLKFLIGYLLYNDGIQTVLAMASVFLSQELFTPEQRLAGADQTFVLEIFLMVQFVAFLGALLFERIAAAVGTKNAILISLLPFLMGAVIAIVLGGSQALSRSLFSRMIPAGREASFFGLYEISERGTSWIGQLIFGIVVGVTGSYREAILSLIVLFILGTVILALTNTDRAVREAGNPLPEEIGAVDVAPA